MKYIKINRLAWAGHLVMMDDHSVTKKIFKTHPLQSRRRGRPKLRWEDMLQDIRLLGVKNWMNQAGDRKVWRDVVRKAHTGLSCHV